MGGGGPQSDYSVFPHPRVGKKVVRWVVGGGGGPQSDYSVFPHPRVGKKVFR